MTGTQGLDAIILSPPYADSIESGDGLCHIDYGKARDGRKRGNDTSGRQGYGASYGHAPGQIGALHGQEGDLMRLLDAILCSPPYAETAVIASGVQRNEPGWQAGKDLSAGKSKDYGTADGQIGALREGELMRLLDAILCSPPYAETLRESPRTIQDTRPSRNDAQPGYGATNGQIGRLKDTGMDTDTATAAGQDQQVETQTWTGCYKADWKAGRFLSPESFIHPAKMARGLLQRIIDFGLERGYWSPGSIVGDCFGGVGTTGLVAAYKGLRSISVELEPRFFRLAAGHDCPGLSKAEWVRWFGRWKRHPDICPLCAKGAEKDYEKGSGIIPDRPAHRYRGNIERHTHRLRTLGCPLPVAIQGDSRQFAALCGEALACVVTSPPYADTQTKVVADSHTVGSQVRPNGKAGGTPEPGCYGTTPGQIGALSAGKDGPALPSLDAEAALAGLAAIVTSPPWANTTQGTDAEFMERMEAEQNPGPRVVARKTPPQDYGTMPGQIGQEKDETYWDAVRTVYSECLKSLKPRGILVVVVKSYVRDKALVDLPSQTATLLSALGFRLFLRVRATLTETTGQPGLFGEDVTKTVKRASFFRRLAEKKGSPIIDEEVVLWARKPETSAQGGAAGEGLQAVLTSPPHANSMESGDKLAHIDFSKSFDGKDHRGKGCGSQGTRSESYGISPGQIGALRAGELVFCERCHTMLVDTQQPQESNEPPSETLSNGPGAASSLPVALGIPASGAACAEAEPCPELDRPATAKTAASASPTTVRQSSDAFDAPTSTTTEIPSKGESEQTPNATSPSLLSSQSETPTGTAAVLIGGASPGEDRSDLPVNETGTSASSAARPSASSPTTSSRHKRRAASGTTASTTCKPSVEAAMPRSTASEGARTTRLCAACAAASSSALPRTPASVLVHVVLPVAESRTTGAASSGALPAGTPPVDLGGASVDAIVTSPPWGDVQDHDTPANYADLNARVQADRKGPGGNFGPSVGANYGDAPGNIGNLPVAPLDLGCLTVSDTLSGSDALPRPLVPHVDARGWRGASAEEVSWWSIAGNLMAQRELARREKGGKRARRKAKRREGQNGGIA